ncbi:MAG TPA: hypothetical protein VL129_00900 [Pseudomonas sp.]|nr:hypothetical protein [Pseudomonas sp.]HTO17693.1 hypothetical protein [Pseudomonas sp.]
MMLRNPMFTRAGLVDCELDHPLHGWIPFTASPNDPDEGGRIIYQLLLDGQFGEIAPYVEPEPVPLTVEQVQSLRRAAYVAESDPLRAEADYDALINGTAPDYTAWIAAVEAIKARYPLPAL